MDLKLVKIASVREHMDAHYRDEISYSKAVDLINEDANKQLLICGVSSKKFNLTSKELTEVIKEAYRNGYAKYEMVEAGLETYDADGYARWSMLSIK